MSGKLSRRSFLTGAAAAVATAACGEPERGREAICTASPKTSPGPYYLAGAPHKTRLVSPDAHGQPIRVFGAVLDGDCAPLPRARLDLWQADAFALYDVDGYEGRGVVIADDEGRFRFDTIVPGRYLDMGRFRPAHIHVTISAPEGRDLPPLTTQLFFEGDPHAHGDRWWNDDLAIALTEEPGQLIGRISIGLYTNRS